MSRLLIPEGTPELYAQTSVSDPLVYAIFTDSKTGWYWLVTEYNQSERQAFGLVIGLESEMGYFDLPDLEQYGIFNLPYPTPEPLSVVRARLEQEDNE